VFIGSRRLTLEEQEAYGQAYEETELKMEAAHKADRDEAVSAFLPKSSAYRSLVGANIGPLESGAEITKTSSTDAVSFLADPDDFIREGVGAFVQRFGRDIPVQLNSPVTAIEYGTRADGGVLVETAGGRTYRGRRVVVTVSTGVLAARRIAFQPELPEWKWEAIHQLPMGLLNKVVFQFSRDILPNEGNSEWVLHQEATAPEGKEPAVMAFVVKPLGANIVVGFYGAEQAHHFEKLGDQAATDYAKAALAEMYGRELVTLIRDDLTKVTRWGKNPWTLGSYSAALPGASKMHAVLARPVEDRVFFAGEACGPVEYNGSLPAAFVSGLEASRGVQESLAQENAAAPEPESALAR
jgi:monoamine oxidase